MVVLSQGCYIRILVILVILLAWAAIGWFAYRDATTEVVYARTYEYKGQTVWMTDHIQSPPLKPIIFKTVYMAFVVPLIFGALAQVVTENLEGGCAVYGYSDGNSFSRAVKAGKVLVEESITAPMGTVDPCDTVTIPFGLWHVDET